VFHVDMDENGLIPDRLDEALVALKAAGRTVKFLYTVPNFHNPAGVCLSVDRRPLVLEICRKHGVIVLEDNPYGMLSFDGTTNPSIYSFDNEDSVIYLGSFSKTFAPGYRVGWALTPPAVRDKLVLASESAILCPSNFAQMAISTYLTHSDWRAQVVALRRMYEERRDAMISALARDMPYAKWNVPTGGFYVWAQLPPGIDTSEMLPRAVEGRVAYVPGSAFYADGQGKSFMRLSFCYPTPEQIHEGIRRLSEVIAAEGKGLPGPR
jgi:DNA-binding transcriptional MocR family regulator